MDPKPVLYSELLNFQYLRRLIYYLWLSGRRAISVDDQLNSMRLTEELEQLQQEQRQPFKQPSTRTLNTKLMSEMRRRLTQLKVIINFSLILKNLYFQASIAISFTPLALM